MQLAYKKKSSNNIPNKAWLGLGGNIGDVPSTLKYALTDIEHSSENHLISVSSFYQTLPCKSGFINGLEMSLPKC